VRAGVGVALVCVVLCGCGVRSQDGPERLPADLLPPELRPSAAAASSRAPTATTARTVPVYLVQDGRLVRRDSPARQRTLDEALAALLVAGDQEGPARSAVPAGTVLERVDVRGQLASLRLSGSFAEVRGRDQLLAVAQLVWTATEFPPVREVDVLVDGRRIELPVEQGEVSSGPARRDDYRSVGPAR
jgi:spore germination protein GerM